MIELRKGRASKSGFLWLLAGALGQNTLQLIAVLVLARIITPAEFGVVSISVVIIAFLRVFAEIGIGPSLVQKNKISTIDIATANTLALLLGLLIGLFVYASAETVADYFEMPELSDVLKVMSLMIPFSSLSIVGQSILQRNFEFKKLTMYTFISYLISYGVVAMGMAASGYKLWSLVFAYLTQTGFLFLLLLFKMREMQKYGFSINSMIDMLRFGFGYSLARMFNFFAGQGDNVLIGKLVGAEALGVYGRAYQVMSMPAVLFGNVIDKFFFPLMSAVQDDKDKLKDVYLNSIGMALLFFVPLSLYVYMFSADLVLILFGEGWEDMVAVLKVMALGLYFRIGYKFSDVLIISVGKVYSRAGMQIVFALLIFGFVFLGSYWGLNGAATGVVAAIIMNYMFMSVLAYSHLRFSIYSFAYMHFKFLVISVIMFYLYRFFAIEDGFELNVISFLYRSAFYMALVIVVFLIFYKVLKKEIVFAMNIISKKRAEHESC